MISKYSLFFAIAIICSFCKNSEKSVKNIDLTNHYQIEVAKSLNNVKSLQLSSIGKKLEYIPLQTDSSCLIKEIFQIALCDSFIFISDFNKLLEFRWDGRFVRQIGSSGIGPAEYIHIYDISVDNINGLIFILSSRNKTLLTFDFSGRFISSFRIPESSMQFIQIDSGDLLFYHGNINKPTVNTLYNWSITDLKGNLKSRLANNFKIGSILRFSVMSIPLYLYNNEVHFLEFGNDTLFRLNGLLRQPYVMFKLGNLSIVPDQKTVAPFVNRDISDKLWINRINEDNKNIYIELVKGKEVSKLFCLFNKKKNELVFLKDNLLKNDIDGFVNFWPKEIYSDTILVDYVDSYSLLMKLNEQTDDTSAGSKYKKNTQLENLKINLKETSNPVIVLLR